MNYIQNNLHNLYKKIQNTANYYNRKINDISLVIVTKNQTIETIENLIQLQELNFGENYIQEGIKKIQHCQKNIKNKKIIWHYIGSIQSNKTKYIAKYFDWCHTIENEKIAHQLNKQRPNTLSPLNILIQINIDHENNKSGISPKELINLSEAINPYHQLCLRGIMCIPKYEKNFNNQLTTFKKMKKLFKILQKKKQNIDTLSCGMSTDMDAAIAAGSTLLRIGKAIFKKNII